MYKKGTSIAHLTRLEIKRKSKKLLEDESNVYRVLQNKESFLIFFDSFYEDEDDGKGKYIKKESYTTNEEEIDFCFIETIIEEYEEYACETLDGILN